MRVSLTISGVEQAREVEPRLRVHLASVLTRRALWRAVDVAMMAGTAREQGERSA